MYDNSPGTKTRRLSCFSAGLSPGCRGNLIKDVLSENSSLAIPRSQYIYILWARRQYGLLCGLMQYRDRQDEERLSGQKVQSTYVD